MARRKKKGAKLGLIGCGVAGLALACCGGLVGGLGIGVTTMLKSTTPYQEAMVLAQTDAALIRDMGQPIEAGLLVAGSVSTSGGSGTADLAWSIHGPDGTGNIYLEAHKTGGQWVYDSLIARLDSTGDIVDLLGTRVLTDGEVTASSSFVAKGNHHLREGRYDEAVYEFDQALGLNDEDNDAWAGRGEAYLRLGDHPAAIADLQKAVGRDPDDIDTQLLLAEAYALTKEWEGCVEAYTQVLRSDGEHAEAWYGRAGCFEGQGEPRKALAGAREACEREHERACQMALRLGGAVR